MDELVRTVSEKAGLPPDKAAAAVQAVIDFAKQRLPAGMGDQVDNFLRTQGSGQGGAAGGLAGQLGGLFGK